MFLKYFTLGFFVKAVTSLDDTLTRIPIIASFTKTRMGKVAFSIGNLIAIGLAIIIAVFFSALIKNFQYYKHISAGLIFALAIAIYFDVFVHKPRARAEDKLKKFQKISVERFTKLVGIGFIASFATVIDDIIAYSPLFLAGIATKIYASLGILIATILEIILVIYFAEKIDKIKYKKEISCLGLVLFGILILAGVF